MNGFILTATLLAATPTPIPNVPDGTLVFLQKSNGVVELYTGSDKTHIGVIFSDAKHRWVYEAAPAKVRRVTLPEYLDGISNLNRNRSKEIQLFLKKPKREFSPRDVYKMRHYVDMQLGRPYTIRNIVRGGNSKGMHCAELVAEGLSRSDRFSFTNPRALSPAQLLKMTNGQYGSPLRVSLKGRGFDQPWCQRTWKSWTDFGTWCRWSCGESFNFFR